MEKPPSQLTTENYLFFQNISQLSLEIKAFYNKILVVEGDIFQDATLAALC